MFLVMMILSVLLIVTVGFIAYRMIIYRLIKRDEALEARDAVTGSLKSAEPFEFKGGKVGVLLVHGFGGTCREMRGLGEYLNAKGYTVKGVALPGHGSSVYQMEKSGWQDYFARVRRGYAELSGRCTKVGVAGLSMGAALSLRLAAEEPGLAAVAVLNPFIYVRYSWYHLLPSEVWVRLLGRLIRFTRKAELGRLRDKQALAEHVACRFLSMRALLTVLDGIAALRRMLPGVRQPILVMQSRGDGTVSQRGARLIYKKTGSPDRELVHFDNSDHVLTLDYDKQEVYEKLAGFFAKHLV